MSDDSSIYRRVSSMEPLLPTTRRGELAEPSAEIFRKAGELKSALPAAAVREGIAELVREMNSYYSNLIEGHKTLPRDIRKALRDELPEAFGDRRDSQLGAAQVVAEAAMRRRLAEQPETDVFAPDFIRFLHREFYEALPREEWISVSQGEIRQPLIPGEFRESNVEVDRHTPPDFSVLGDFMNRFQEFYAGPAIPATERPLALAAAHHRLVWIHPFGDGNGRVARLQALAAAIRAGLDDAGLWMLSRGLARARPANFNIFRLRTKPVPATWTGGET